MKITFFRGFVCQRKYNIIFINHFFSWVNPISEFTEPWLFPSPFPVMLIFRWLSRRWLSKGPWPSCITTIIYHSNKVSTSTNYIITSRHDIVFNGNIFLKKLSSRCKQTEKIGPLILRWRNREYLGQYFISLKNGSLIL